MNVGDVTDTKCGPKKEHEIDRGAASPLPPSIAAIEKALDVLSRCISERRARIAADCALAIDRERRP
jgi:hypothetical protein